MNANTLVPFGLSLVEAKNQWATKHPQISGFKVTHYHVERIKKIREHELHLEPMVEIPFTLRPRARPTLKPFTPYPFLRDLDGNELI